MIEPDRMPSVGERIAGRAAARLRAGGPGGPALAQVDPATIALILAVARLVLLWIERRSARPREAVGDLRRPRWWQPLKRFRRREVLASVSRLVGPAALDAPEACLDAVLDELRDSNDADLATLIGEVSR